MYKTWVEGLEGVSGILRVRVVVAKRKPRSVGVAAG